MFAEIDRPVQFNEFLTGSFIKLQRLNPFRKIHPLNYPPSRKGVIILREIDIVTDWMTQVKRF